MSRCKDRPLQSLDEAVVREFQPWTRDLNLLSEGIGVRSGLGV